MLAWYTNPNNMKQKIDRDRGFTIIEVLIVLAIAGLIMLMVFLAVPKLQASARDSRRRTDLTLFYNAVREYQLVRGSTKSPFVDKTTDQAKFDKFVDDYVGDTFDEYDIYLADDGESHSFDIVVDKIIYFPLHYCPDNETEQVSGKYNHSNNAFAVLIGTERTNSYACLDQGNKDID
jgi:prepilin-type N-terminal cleavage/methylation domain-containing protein